MTTGEDVEDYGAMRQVSTREIAAAARTAQALRTPAPAVAGVPSFRDSDCARRPPARVKDGMRVAPE